MGSKTDQIKGYANEAAGKVKQGVGKAIGNDRLRAKGAAQEAKGDVRRPLAKPRAQSRTWPTRSPTRHTKNSDNQRLMLFCQRPAQQGRPSIPDVQRNSLPLAPKDRPRNNRALRGSPLHPKPIRRSSKIPHQLMSSPRLTAA